MALDSKVGPSESDGVDATDRVQVRALVTGAAGFIGMHVSLRLLERGDEVVGFDSLNDRIAEQGAASDTDRVVMDPGIRPADVSLVRQEQDLLIELEHDDGLTIDTVLVQGHFDGPETGIEQVGFANGAVWTRTDMDALSRLGRFNAADDVVRFVPEDTPYRIEAEWLIENDAEASTEGLRIIAVGGFTNGSATVEADGSVTFLSAQDFFGDAFFDYTVADDFGRESTATVEVNVLNVNDAPFANDDGIFHGVEDTPLFIPLADLLGNDGDVDGDTLSIFDTKPLVGVDGEYLYPSPGDLGTNGKPVASMFGVTFYPTGDHFGFAGFQYSITDGNGESATASVELHFTGVNDAPRPNEDYRTTRMDASITIPVSALIGNDDDPEDDPLSFISAGGAEHGTLVVEDVVDGDSNVRSVIFTPEAGFLGDASFTYVVADDRGAEAVGDVSIRVIPLNDPPRARDDGGYRTVQDERLIIDSAELLANDSDPNDDTLVIAALDRFPENGEVAFTDDGLIAFDPRPNYNGDASFTYRISDGRGGEDEATVSIFIEPANEAPIVRDDVINGFEDLPLYLSAFEAFANDSDPEGDVLFFDEVEFLGEILNDFSAREPIDLALEPAALGLPEDADLVVTRTGGAPLPEWLTFDKENARLAGTPPEAYVGRLMLTVVATVTDPATGEPQESSALLELVVDESILFDTGALSTDYDARPSVDLSVSADDLPAEPIIASEAMLRRGDPLPAWLTFDPSTFTFTGTPPPRYVGELELRVVVETEDPQTGERASRNIDLPLVVDTPTDFPGRPGGFRLSADGDDYRIQTPEDWFGTIALRYRAEDIKEAVSDEWAIAVINIAPQRELPDAMDDSFRTVEEQSILIPFETLLANDRDDDGDVLRIIDVPGIDAPNVEVSLFAEPFELVLPDSARVGLIEDFVYYELTLADGGSLPDWLRESDGVISGLPPVGFSGDLEIVATARDGSGKSVVSEHTLKPLPTGTLALGGTALSVEAPDGAADGLAEPVFSATLADGSSLPDWLAVDAATGTLSGTPPLDAAPSLEVLLVAEDGAERVETSMTLASSPAEHWSLDYRPGPGFTGTERFDYRVTDDREGAVDATITVQVIPAASLPIARNDDGFTLIEDTTLIIHPDALLANDSDFDGDPLRVVWVGNAENGAVVLSDTGISFTAAPNYDGPASFDYRITDDRHGEATATVSLEITPSNRAPLAVNDRFAGVEDSALVLHPDALLANDIDPDGDPVTFVGVSTEAPHGRAFELPDGRLSFTPDADWNGEVVFEYQITDGRLESPDQQDGQTYRQIVIDFAPVNDAPRPRDDAGFETAEDTPIRIDPADLLANDSDVEGDAITLVGARDPVNGAVEFDGSEITFTPRPNYFGNGGFSYVVRDAHGAEATGFVSLTVLPEQDFPIAIDDWVGRIDEGGSLLIDPATLLANDIDPDGGKLHFDGLLRHSGGVVDWTEDGRIRFTGDPDFDRLASMTYQISNPDGLTATGHAYIEVTPIPDAPRPGPDAFDGVEDEALVIPILDLLANDSDPEGQTVQLTALSQGSGGTAALDGRGNVVFTPQPDVFGSAGFGYTVSDTTGLSASTTVSIELAPAADAPTVVSAPAPLRAAEDQPFSLALPADVFTDADADPLTLRVTGADGAALPAWMQSADGRLSGRAPADFNGAVALMLVASDGAAEASVDLDLMVEPVNDAPTVVADSFDGVEDEPLYIPVLDLLANDSDIDGDGLALTRVLGSEGLAAVLDGQGNVIATPATDRPGRASFSYEVTDAAGATAQGRVELMFAPVNDAPRVVNPLADLSVPEDSELAAALPEVVFDDPDGNAMVLRLGTPDGGAAPAWLRFDPDSRQLTGTPPKDQYGVVELALLAADGEAETAAPFMLHLAPVNDAPRLIAPLSDRYIDAEQAFDIVLQTNTVIDSDGDDLSAELLPVDAAESLPDWLLFDATAARLYGTAPAGFSGPVDLRMRWSDAERAVEDVFTLHVTAANAPPVFEVSLADQRVDEDTAVDIALPASMLSDPDGDDLSVAARLADGEPLPDWLSFDGERFTGTPPSDLHGDYEIAVLASDGQHEVGETFVLAIAPAADAPVANDDGPLEMPTDRAMEIAAADLLANDSDADGDALRITGVGDAAHGQIVLTADGDLRYTPASGFVGEDRFQYTVSDGEHTATAEATIAVDNPYRDWDKGGETRDKVTRPAEPLAYDAGDGEDRVLAGDYDDAISGGSGRDIVRSGDGRDFVDGGGGADHIDGGRGDDNLLGGDGNDRLLGGEGDDELSGGAGRDLLWGGAGNDVFHFADGDGRNMVMDFTPNTADRSLPLNGDRLSLRIEGVDDFDTLLLYAVDNRAGVTFDFGEGDELFLRGTQLAALDKDAFSFF